MAMYHYFPLTLKFRRLSIMTLSSRLLQVERELLDAISCGKPALDSFMSRWAALLEEISSTATRGELDERTHQLAQTTAAQVVIIADSFLGMDTDTAAVESKFTNDIDAIYSQCGHASSSKQPRLSFVEACYKWLTENLHNPYPSESTKAYLAHGSHVTVDSVNGWFLKARRRVGWTALVKADFGGCRADAVKAAQAVFCDAGANEDSVDAAVVCKLMQVQHNTESMYGSRFCKGELLESLSAIMQDSVGGGVTRTGKRHRTTSKRSVRPSPSQVLYTAATAYPSPASSVGDLLDHNPIPRNMGKRSAVSAQSSMESIASTSSDEYLVERSRHVPIPFSLAMLD
jgi:hypothetical protein